VRKKKGEEPNENKANINEIKTNQTNTQLNSNSELPSQQSRTLVLDQIGLFPKAIDVGSLDFLFAFCFDFLLAQQ
jgi:hypothetical protein